MKQTYYSIRTVVATTQNKAISKVERGMFDESHELCDKVVTEKELIRLLTGGKPQQDYVVEVPVTHKQTLQKDGFLATDHVKGKVLICVYSRGQALKKAIMFGGKAKLFKGKISNTKHYKL